MGTWLLDRPIRIRDTEYGCEREALSLLLKTPALAHVSEKQLSAHLKILYENDPDRYDVRKWHCPRMARDIDSTVPLSLFEAERRGLLRERLFRLAPLIPAAISRFGKICALCLFIESEISALRNNRFRQFVIQDDVRLQYSEDLDAFCTPFCDRCAASIHGYVQRTFPSKRVMSQHDSLAVLCWLYLNKAFNQRCHEQRLNAKLLRFDPRKKGYLNPKPSHRDETRFERALAAA